MLSQAKPKFFFHLNAFVFSVMNSAEEFDSNPFNFQPLKRRKNPTLKSQKVKRVKTTNPSQKPTYVQKTLNFNAEIEKPIEQQQRKSEGILVFFDSLRRDIIARLLIFQCVLSARFLWIY